MHYWLCGLSCGWSSSNSLAKGDDRRGSYPDPWLANMVNCQRAKKKYVFIWVHVLQLFVCYVIKKLTRNENILSKLCFLNASLE